MLGAFRAAVGSARRHDNLYFSAMLSEKVILDACSSGKRASTRESL